MKTFSSALLTALIATSTIANAADLSRPMAAPPPYVMPIYDWSGFYAGANIGGGWASTTLSDSVTGAQIGNSTAGVIGGSQLGFNYQTGNLVFGAEWTIEGTSLGATHAVGLLQGSAHTGWLTTLAGRFGWAADNWLFYGKAGGGWADTSATMTNLANGMQVSGSHTSAGWLAGGGIEYGVSRNWTVKLEYNYLGLDSWNAPSTIFSPNSSRFSVNPNIQMLTVGFNYKF